MSSLLVGKLALVTGAGSGIGRATCKLLARDGAKVIAADRNLNAAEVTAKSINSDLVFPLEVDVSSKNSVTNAVISILSKFQKPPSIVVNSAGITRDGYMLKLSEQEYDDVYSVNLKGTFLVTQTLAKAMIEHKIEDGSIINISSINAKLNPIGQANYAATKAGVISFTEVVAKEFGKFGIRVNVILPGYIDTPMSAVVPDNIKHEVLSKCPMKRLGQGEEVAEVIAFLASNKSSYVNGASIKVTGGL